jgi:hypothetical protein
VSAAPSLSSSPAFQAGQLLQPESCQRIAYGADGNPGPVLCADGHLNAYAMPRRPAFEASLPPVSLKSLRHGAATYALAAGLDIKLVQAKLDHSSSTLTRDVYTSVLPDVAQAAAEAAASIVPRAVAGTGGLPTDSQTAATSGLRSVADGKRQVRPSKASGAGGARTHDRRIMSPLL